VISKAPFQSHTSDKPDSSEAGKLLSAETEGRVAGKNLAYAKCFTSLTEDLRSMQETKHCIDGDWPDFHSLNKLFDWLSDERQRDW